MRYLAILALAVMVGCAAKPSPLQVACNEGDIQACQVLEQNRLNALMALGLMGRQMQPAPAPARTSMTCYRLGVFLRCN